MRYIIERMMERGEIAYLSNIYSATGVYDWTSKLNYAHRFVKEETANRILKRLVDQGYKVKIVEE